MHGAVGGINENDVKLAEVTESVIIGFNVRPDGKTRRLAEEKGIEIRTYGIIYELLEELEQMLVGKLAPDEVEVVLGNAEVRATFKVPRIGLVAGCYVTDGEIVRNSRARLLRDGVVVFDGQIGSLRRFKDDVRSVAAGFECGIGLEGFNDIKDGDVIEAYQIREIARA
jgi:translation initiation factor IF-2